MKLTTVFFVTLLLGTICAAQQTFEHIVIVVQENRTPDNLFGGGTIAGADIQRNGSSLPLGTETYDPPHSHSAFVNQAAGDWDASTIAYVQASDVQPYFQIARRYGFANRMFQTNQGPSQPAHHFLFAGTSAPSDSSLLMESENGGGGCLGLFQVPFIDSTGNESTHGSTCLDPSTIADLLKAAGISWRYYAPTASSIWNAPGGNQRICVPVSGVCTGADWVNVDLNPPDVLSDIASNNLRAVSWVIPAGQYSDHATSGNGGPNWVASIVDAIGRSPYWANTAILITWDDWGGWYDHVSPTPNNTGWCVSYCYGFRVPLLVVSTRTPHLIDNATHDFGSILRFVESNFGLGLIGPGFYADAYSDNLAVFFQGEPRPYLPMSLQHVDWRRIPNSDPDTE